MHLVSAVWFVQVCFRFVLSNSHVQVKWETGLSELRARQILWGICCFSFNVASCPASHLGWRRGHSLGRHSVVCGGVSRVLVAVFIDFSSISASLCMLEFDLSPPHVSSLLFMISFKVWLYFTALFVVYLPLNGKVSITQASLFNVMRREKTAGISSQHCPLPPSALSPLWLQFISQRKRSKITLQNGILLEFPYFCYNCAPGPGHLFLPQSSLW